MSLGPSAITPITGGPHNKRKLTIIVKRKLLNSRYRKSLLYIDSFALVLFALVSRLVGVVLDFLLLRFHIEFVGPD